MKLIPITRFEIISYTILAFILIIGAYFSFTNDAYFNTVYAAEDGLAESATAVVLFAISVLTSIRLFKLWASKKGLWKFGMIVLILVFIFGAGEEISWGQRIFNVESSEYFLENNAQGETNLHNMVVNGKKVNKIVFSQILTLVLVIYLLIVPFLYRKLQWVRTFLNQFSVPVATWSQVIAFLSLTAIITIMPSSRKWELYELGFGIIFFLIVYNPFNKAAVYNK
ncbi:MAG: hypothetical protein COB81_04510 [Flavobacteriaceae bacterium]|nr:MAG: hypothetical protein COB81_04510 [Flavobacteriaceae bacterium]